MYVRICGFFGFGSRFFGVRRVLFLVTGLGSDRGHWVSFEEPGSSLPEDAAGVDSSMEDVAAVAQFAMML